MGKVLAFPKGGHRPDHCPVCTSFQPDPIYVGKCKGCGEEIWLIWVGLDPEAKAPQRFEPHYSCDGKGNVEEWPPLPD
jgi:hypothetical protein